MPSLIRTILRVAGLEGVPDWNSESVSLGLGETAEMAGTAEMAETKYYSHHLKCLLLSIRLGD